MRYIEQKLKEYNEKKLQKEIIEMRIEAYKYAIDHPEIRINEFPIVNPFAIRENYNKGLSIVEKNTLSEEDMRKLIIQEIEDEESRINHIILEIKSYELALGQLTISDNYIIDCKLFSSEKLAWKDIEINYNNRFRKEKSYKYVPEGTLRNNYYKALDKLEGILFQNNKERRTS